MEQAWSTPVGANGVRVNGFSDGAAIRAELRIIGGSLTITELHLTLDPSPTGQELARTTGITSDTLRSVSFERIHQEARDLLAARLPALPDETTFTATELAAAAESLLPDDWHAALLAARERLAEDRSRRGRPTDKQMLLWLAHRYVELDRDPARPNLRRTLAEEATRREGAEVSEATIGKRLRRATELGFIVGREASRRGGSRLGPGYFAYISEKGTA